MNAHAQRVRSRFDGEAENWNAQYQNSAARSIYAHNLLRRQQQTHSLIDRTGERLLELGCGAGNVLLSVAANRGLKPFGADFSPGMLAQARKNAQAKRHMLPLLAADACQLPFLAGSFDVILCLGVIEYIPGYEQVLSECARILRPGGQLIVSVPNATSPFVRLDDTVFRLKNEVTHGLIPSSLRAWLKTRLLGRTDNPYFNHKKQRFFPDQFRAKLLQAGLEVKAQRYHTYGLGLFEGIAWNVRISEYLEKQAATHPNMEKLGWTCILKAVKL